jgi:hypothetical protein
MVATLAAVAAGAPTASAATGRIFTAAGTATFGFSGDGGPAAAAQLTSPTWVTITADGGYLIADQGNSRVRRVSPSGAITTVAGRGSTGFSGDDGPATSAQLNAPNGVAELPNGSILIADSNNNRVRRVAPDGTITTVAGTGAAGFTGDNGPAAQATISFPIGLAARPDGSYLIGDNDNNRVRLVSATGTITTVAGTGIAGSLGDSGPATSAQLNDPGGVALTADGGFLVTEILGNRVRRVGPDGTITTAAGTGAAAELSGPSGVAVTADAGFVVADRGNNRVRRVSATGAVDNLAGTGTAGYNGDDIAAATAQLNLPLGVAVNSQGDVLIADTSNHRVRLVDLGDPPPPPAIGDPPPPPANPPASITLNIESVTRTPGDPNTVTGTVRRRDGSLAPGAQVRYAITGSNPGGGLLNADNNGAAAVGWEGVHDGTDTIAMWSDLNGNATQDATEPSDTATVNWVLPVPQVAKTVNIEPVSGRVLVKLPASAKQRARDPWVEAAQSGFIPLEEARSVPVGTIVDTHNGTVELTAAANTQGATQASQFWMGNFQIRQVRSSRPVTELRLNETLVCRSGQGSARLEPSRARSRSLWGKGKGRFRTRGRHSTATVRGTTWFTKDTCGTTTTLVREGTVTVRDFAKRKDVRVRAGKRYVARAGKRR